MKNMNIKKLLSGFISLCIIMGMAALTFATDIDMSAFITKDEYLTKYHEIEYRVDDIDDRLDRLYKFTCTNVRTFGGSVVSASPNVTYRAPRGASVFTSGYKTTQYKFYTALMASCDEEGYLVVNSPAQINYNVDRSNTVTLEKSYPASILKWRDGIEPAPTCEVKVKIDRRFDRNSTTAAYDSKITEDIEIVMGPFDKYPAPQSAGPEYNKGFICTLPDFILRHPGQQKSGNNYSDNMYYQIGTETEPTEWNSITKGSSNLSVYARDRDSAYHTKSYTSSFATDRAYHYDFTGNGDTLELYYSGATPFPVKS